MLASRLPRAVARSSQRAYHDISSVSPSKIAVGQGPPGYSAVTGHTVTVFGCTGFLGRYIVSKLAKQGTHVVVPYRDEDEKRHLKLMGDLGQVVPMEWDLRNEQQIAECLRHSDTVYNLVGRDHETKNFTFKAVNADGAERIAKIAADNGVSKFIHFSHLNASHNSPSAFYRTKAESEDLVKAAFPDATIMKPAAMYGYEDKLLNNMAVWPVWWKMNWGETKMRPVHVMDVAQAAANLMHAPLLPGNVHLPGPSTLTQEWLLELVDSVTLRPPSRAPAIPKALAKFICNVAEKSVWWPTLSPDEIERRLIDDADTPGDWDLVGVQPAEIEQFALTYLRRYRAAEDYVRPPTFPPRPVFEAKPEF